MNNDNSTYPVNPDFECQQLRVGNSGTVVLVIDNFFTNTEKCRAYAQNSAAFSHEVRSYYPGMRAVTHKDYDNAVALALEKTLREIYGIPPKLKYVVHEGCYSLMTTREEQLTVGQRIPHFDCKHLHYFALLHYLNEGDFDGTAFYRHKPTGIELILENNVKPYLQRATDFIKANGYPKAQYISDSNDHYELIGQVDYKPNRLVVYPGSLLHSPYIKDSRRNLSADIKHGRLTGNFFSEFV